MMDVEGWVTGVLDGTILILKVFSMRASVAASKPCYAHSCRAFPV